MDLIEVKEFLRVDTNEEDSLINGLQLAAEEYLSNAGVKKDYNKELYKLAVKLLISHWYENRSVVLVGSISRSFEFSLSCMISQLQCY